MDILKGAFWALLEGHFLSWANECEGGSMKLATGIEVKVGAARGIHTNWEGTAPWSS